VHAENSDCITWLTTQAGAGGARRRRSITPGRGRRPSSVRAPHRAITMSEIVDVADSVGCTSPGADAVEQIRWAQGRGIRIYAETCPQYLVLTAEHLDVPGFEGAKVICSPPPRDVASQQAIWNGLASGVFHVVSSDHSPFRFDDPAGKKRLRGRCAVREGSQRACRASRPGCHCSSPRA